MHRFITDFILDITQNSFEANSNHVCLQIEEDQRYLKFTVRDDGKGMSDETLRKVLDPYYTDGIKHSKRKVGLGLPLLVQTIRETNGKFDINSKLGEGTVVNCMFDMCNIDTPPLGDIPSTLLALFNDPSSKDFIVKRLIKTDKGGDSYELSKKELIEVLGSFDSVSELILLRDFLKNQEDELQKYYVERKLIF